MDTTLSLIICAAVGVIVLIAFISVYNSLISLRNGAKAAWAQIEVRLQQRYDLIPNLVNTAKKYMQHERETLEAVIAARDAAYTARQENTDPTNAQSMGKLMSAEGGLAGAMSRLMAVAEAYPDLKANQQMLSLMQSLSDQETSIARARETYNNAAMQYNIKRETFPNSLLASLFGFMAAELFRTAGEEVRKAPKVSFD